MTLKRMLIGLGVLGSLSGFAEQAESKQVSGSFIQVVLDSGVTGILIWLMLFICSVLTVWVLVDSCSKIKRSKICPVSLLAECKENLEKGDIGSLLEACSRSNSIFALIATRVFNKLGKGYEAMEESAAVGVRDEEDKLMQRVNYLNMFGAIAPMLGLLGTVTGMVSAFFTLGNASGVEKAQLLAMSISQALYTTAAGLFISIPAIVAYNIFKNKVQNEISYVETEINDMLQDVKGRI